MNYITIEIDKKFLIRTALTLGFLISVFGSYRVGYAKGVEAAVEYMMSALQGKSKLNLDS